MLTSAHERGLDRIADLVGHGLDMCAFWDGASSIVAPLVPHQGGTCWYTLDPASLLITSHVNREMEVLPPAWLQVEYSNENAHDLAGVARSPMGTSTLHDATAGDPRLTVRGQAIAALGGEQELLVALRSRSGEAWGGLALYREPGRPRFHDAEVAFLSAASAALGEGARRALLLGEAQDPEGPDAPAVIVLTASGELESATPGAEHWLSDLPGGDWDRGCLPTAVHTVAMRALRSPPGADAAGEVAVARVLSRSGIWAVLHGARLVSAGPRRVVVIVETAHPSRIAPLLMSAYGLTAREQEITRLVLQGESTAAVAERLVISPFTVQEHLKHIFGKTGVRSRRDLVGKVFLDHYEPRVRDNETRALNGKPLRGGPLTGR